MARTNTRPRRRLTAGTKVVCTNGSLIGADAFTLLRIIRTHQNGTVDVANDEDGTTWTAVTPRALTPITT